MDLGTIGGIVVCFILIFASFIIGGSSPLLYWDLPSVLITVLGSFATIVISNPMRRVTNLVKVYGVAARIPKLETEKTIRILVEFSERARREGLLALEDNVQELDDEFMRKGVQLVVDGTDPEIIKTILENEMGQIESRHFDNCKLIDDWSKLAPAFGMIGTLIGLVAMLANLEDKSAIGPNMAVALITTFYGALMSYILLSPVKAKLDDRTKNEMLLKSIMLEGVLSIQAGDNPRVLLEKLVAFLPPKMREALRAEQKD